MLGQRMSGQVRMSQAVNPPLNVTLPVKGSYTDRGGRHLAKLASPEMPGRRVTMVLTISKNWKAATGAYTNASPKYFQTTGFVLDPEGRVITAVYSSGAIGRLMPDDVAGFIRYVKEHA